MQKNFWSELNKPIMGLSPMDGVTDAAFRFITAKYGKPAVTITEFTSAEGLAAGAIKLLDDFIYSDIERPVVAQVFGSDPRAFFKAGALAAALGFDGLDINMGCPVRNVAEHGGGAALIRTPHLAQDLIRSAKAGIKVWADGARLEEVGVHQAIIDRLKSSDFDTRISDISTERREIPVSVKTRIGYDVVVIEDWVRYLLETEPAAISIHGRTLKQLYSGFADWDAIAKAAAIIRNAGTLVLGNGDVKDLADAQKKIAEYGVDGVLMGRASFGNPWIFRNTTPSVEEKLCVAVEHAHVFEELLPKKNFLHMRKHLGWYASGFDGAKELRSLLMQPSVKNAVEVERMIGRRLHSVSGKPLSRFVPAFAS